MEKTMPGEGGYTVRPNYTIATGMWKFRDKVEVGHLLALADGWLQGSDGSNYFDLHVRTCSKDQIGIGFKYRYEEGGYHAFFDKMTDLLKRKFGNDFVGWDVSPHAWVLK